MQQRLKNEVYGSCSHVRTPDIYMAYDTRTRTHTHTHTQIQHYMHASMYGEETRAICAHMYARGIGQHALFLLNQGGQRSTPNIFWVHLRAR